jgi:hypothetical protein
MLYLFKKFIISCGLYADIIYCRADDGGYIIFEYLTVYNNSNNNNSNNSN